MSGILPGRKNHYGSCSRRGTEVAALLYSLIETENLVGVGPPSNGASAHRRAVKTGRARSY